MRVFCALCAVFCGLTLPARATVIQWYADLDSAQEIPPNISVGTGFGLVQFDDSTNVLQLDLSWQNLTGEGLQAHIHCCVATPPGNVGIALDLWLTSDPRPSSGSYNATYDLDLENPFRAAFTTANGGTALGAFNALSDAMSANQGRAYFNIHTELFPGGEIRGNLAEVPEPASLLTILSGVAVLLVLGRRGVRPANS